MAKGLALLAAGGTGGHLFPAQALAGELTERGWQVHLATDPRAKRFVDAFPANGVHLIESATFSGKNPFALARTAWRLASGYRAARALIGKLSPSVVVGFGGYPTVPPLLAASRRKVPCVLHEQNAVMGRANRFLARRVQAIGAGFELVDGSLPDDTVATVTGNPLRDVAHEAAKIAYAPPVRDDAFNLLVFGGSQGARFFSTIIPEALRLLEPDRASRLRVTIQSRPEDKATLISALAALNVDATVESFFDDLPMRIAASHLVICRAGASSVAELALIGRPSILVPLPGALDDDQGANALRLETTGGAMLVRQGGLSADRLRALIDDMLDDPAALASMAKKAKEAGVPDAATRLADLVETIASA